VVRELTVRRPFHESQYDWSKPVESYWETLRAPEDAGNAMPLNSDKIADVAIIGAGYCGLSAAYHLVRKGIEVVVVEAGPLGWGASGRNGGFCCVGASWLGPTELAAQFGEVEAIGFYRAQVEAVRLVEQLAAEEQIDVQRQGDGIWIFAHKPSRLKELDAHGAALQRVGIKTRIVSAEAFEREAFACGEQHGGQHEAIGFGLNAMAYCQGLAQAAQKRGAVLHSNSRVTSWTREGDRHRLTTRAGSLRAKRVIVAANGWFPEELIPELQGRVWPILSNVITTRPLTEDELAGQRWTTQTPASNTRNLLSYLRLLPDKRLLFGGRGDTAGTPSGGLAMRRMLTRRMGQLFPAFRDAEITHSWRGFIAATLRLTPAVGELPSDPSVSYAFGCHGNGVAFMTWAGRELAMRISGDAKQLPAPLRGLPPLFPLPSLRRWQLRAMLARAWIEDAF
jgi:glycine/D-amino acid oxidase-like deaminating enzyme